MNYEQAMEYIHAVQWAGHKPGLTRTRTLLAALGDPHKQLRFVHVAGTNGKGSTAAMMASCLQAAGYRVVFRASAAWLKLRKRHTSTKMVKCFLVIGTSRVFHMEFNI